MAGNISSVQREYDYDFIGFTYNGKHSIRDLNIYRVSNGSRYDFALAPTITDKSMEIPGNDGMYFFNTFHKQRQFTINIAFSELTETGLRTLRQLFNGKEIGELIFDEAPYKVYAAKITGTPTIKAICFDEKKENGGLQRIYRGEGTLQFTCYQPYAYTPEWVWEKTGDVFGKRGFSKYGVLQQTGIPIDGRDANEYKEAYQTKDEWVGASGLFNANGRNKPSENSNYVINYGDVPAPFVVRISGDVEKDHVIRVGEVEVTILEACSDLVWDSRTGIISGTFNKNTTNEVTRPINYSGVSCGTIPTGGVSVKLHNLVNSQVEYKFWYY